jgi:predicted phosphodiesterase
MSGTKAASYDLPASIREVSQWGPVNVAGPGDRVGILSDIHAPYHDEGALSVAIDSLVKINPTVVILNGDTIDFYSVSRFQTDPEQRDLGREIEIGRGVLRHIRKRFPKARIVFKVGNHEERWRAYLIQHAADLLGLSEFQLPAVLNLPDHDISIVGDKRPLMVGRLPVLHGHEYKSGFAPPVNPARGLFLRAKASALCGHYHQRSEHQERTLEGSILATWSTGCLCQRNPQYMPLNNWSHGFAVVTVTKGGLYHVENRIIIDGKIY